MGPGPYQTSRTSTGGLWQYNQKMPTAAFTTLGCKVNQYETQQILESFENAGFGIVPFDQKADVYVINTCSVTSIAESKSRYTIRKAARSNPDAKVVVTGCAAQMSINKSEEMEGAHLVVPNPEKLSSFQKFIAEFPEFATAQKTEISHAPAFGGRTRATLKIQDGCNIMCSYCSIPFTRPGMVSRPASELLDETKRLADLGYQEVVLTGVLIGAYGPETGSGGPDFEDVVELLSQKGGMPRVRISSIEMRQVTPRLIGLIQAGWVVPHLHIPLQCGDSGVLTDMNRPYSKEDYLELCDRLYDEVPDISLTADVMVGFPTETDERFENSLDTIQRAKLLKAHVFRFSPRFGTPADAYGDPVSPPVKADRALRLSQASAETGRAHARKFVGRTLRTLVVGKETREGLLSGLTDNYLEVAFAGPKSLSGTLCWVRIDEVKDHLAYGEVVSQPSSTRTPISIVE